MTTADLSAIVRGIAPILREQVNGAISGLLERVSMLEQRPVPRDGRDGANGKDGRDGIDGKDGADGLKGTDGLNGKDGAPGTDGKDGINGADGKDGLAGADGINGKDGVAGLNGKDGTDGIAGKDGAPGRDGVNGKDGRDADPGLLKSMQAEMDALRVEMVAIKAMQPSFVVDEAGDLHWTWGGELKRAGRVRGADGRDGKDGLSIKGDPGQDGKDGKDGLGFDDMQFSHDGERTAAFRWTRNGELAREQSFPMPAFLDRGVWKGDMAYVKGDVVTYGGSMWTAQAESLGIRPGDGAESAKVWRLAVKHGRDGKNGIDGQKGERGPMGPAGKDWGRPS